jgi:hypothetical protein
MPYDADLYDYPSLAEEAHYAAREEQEAADEEARRADAEAADAARERAFLATATPHCSGYCSENLAHTAACQALNAPTAKECMNRLLEARWADLITEQELGDLWGAYCDAAAPAIAEPFAVAIAGFLHGQQAARRSA